MAENGNNDLDYQQKGGNLTNSSSSEMHIATTTMNSGPFRKSSNGVDLIFSNSWNPSVSLSQNEEFKASAMGTHNPAVSPYTVGLFGNHGTCSDSHMLRYPLDPNLLERPPNLSSFGSGSFSAMVSSFGLPEYDQVTNAGCPDYPSNEEIRINLGKAEDRDTMVRGDLQISDEGGSGSSPDGKKRKGVLGYHLDTVHSHFQNGEAEQRRGVSQESPEGLKEQDGKKQKTEKNSGPNSRGKSTGKQAKDSSQNEQSSKEDYIHVRARRGQATNSHSLAERVRREKISQRMKYLQDLVPGCDKITGKALMLDEIINYVQSLQCQVEFLSMKLAAVNPQLNIDMDRIMSKDILHSQVGGSTILGFGSGISSSHSQPPMSSQEAIQAIHCTNSHSQPGSQMPTVWDGDLQNMFQMGLKSDPALDGVGLNGEAGATNLTC